MRPASSGNTAGTEPDMQRLSALKSIQVRHSPYLHGARPFRETVSPSSNYLLFFFLRTETAKHPFLGQPECPRNPENNIFF